MITYVMITCVMITYWMVGSCSATASIANTPVGRSATTHRGGRLPELPYEHDTRTRGRLVEQAVVVSCGQLPADVPGVDYSGGLDQHRGDFAFAYGAVLDAAGHHVQLAGCERHVAVA